MGAARHQADEKQGRQTGERGLAGARAQARVSRYGVAPRWLRWPALACRDTHAGHAISDFEGASNRRYDGRLNPRNILKSGVHAANTSNGLFKQFKPLWGNAQPRQDDLIIQPWRRPKTRKSGWWPTAHTLFFFFPRRRGVHSRTTSVLATHTERKHTTVAQCTINLNQPTRALHAARPCARASSQLAAKPPQAERMFLRPPSMVALPAAAQRRSRNHAKCCSSTRRRTRWCAGHHITWSFHESAERKYRNDHKLRSCCASATIHARRRNHASSSSPG